MEHPDATLETVSASESRGGRPMAQLTRLESFLQSRGIKPVDLARQSGYSRQHLLRIRKGTMEPTRRCIAAIVAACRRLSHQPVKPSDVFELGDTV